MIPLSYSRLEQPKLSKHIEACKDLSQIENLLEKEVRVRIESAASDRITVKGYSGSISVDVLSEKIKKLATTTESIAEPYLLGRSMTVKTPTFQENRVANLLIEKVFVPIKKDFFKLDRQNRLFYVSMNAFPRSETFPDAASKGFGVFAHAQPLLTLGKSPDELRERFLRKEPDPDAASKGFEVFAHAQPLLRLGKSPDELRERFLRKEPDVEQSISVTRSILFPSSKRPNSEIEN